MAELESTAFTCSQDLRPIGEESSEALRIHSRAVASDRRCLQEVCLRLPVKTATKPAQPIEKSTAGASLLAHVIVSKIADHLPVHRQGKILEPILVYKIPDSDDVWLRCGNRRNYWSHCMES